MKKQIKIFLIFIIILLFSISVVYVSCTSNEQANESLRVEEKETEIGIIRKYYNEEGELVKEEYPDGSIITYKEQGEVIEIEKPNQEKLVGYKVHLSTDDIYNIENFTYKDKINIDKGTLILAKTIKGYMEGIILPYSSSIFKYSEKEKGEIEYLYIRFDPYKYDNLLKNNIVDNSVENKEAILDRAWEIHNRNFYYMMHISEYAMLHLEHLAVTVKIKDKNLYLKDFNFEGYVEDFKPYTIIEGRLKPYFLDWNAYKEDIFNVYYPDNSLIKNNPKEWLDKRRHSFNDICEYLGVKWEYGEISFFVFNDREQGKEYGLTLGFAIPSINEIYTLHNQSYGHELTHIVSYRINNGKRIHSALINEGLATYLNGNNHNFHRITKYFLEKDELDKYNLLNDGFRDCPGGYFYGASFVNYLIDEYGLVLFKEFFGQEEYSEIKSFKKFYDKDYKALYDEWKNFLQNNDFGELTKGEIEVIKMIEDLG